MNTLNASLTTHAPAAAARDPAPVHPHHGMPPLDQDGPPLSFFEFWPMWAFYPPVMAYAAWLMLRHRGMLLPTVANPSFPGGGFYRRVQGRDPGPGDAPCRPSGWRPSSA